MSRQEPHIAVIGAGASGLFAANLLAEKNIRTTLFEAHALPGGCASWFRRQTAVGPCIFDVGATVVPSFRPDAWWAKTLQRWNIANHLGYQNSQSVRFDIDDHAFEVSCDDEKFFDDLAEAFPQDAEWISRRLKPTLAQIVSLQKFVEFLPQWPIESTRQAFLNLKKLKHLPMHMDDIKLLFKSFDEWLGDDKLSLELRTWFEMNALISIQCKLSDAYAMYALFAILFHSTGSGTFSGGMKTYFESLLKLYRGSQDSRYYPNTKITRLQNTSSGYILDDSKLNSFGPFSKVIFSTPRQLSQAIILGQKPEPPSDDMWSAIVIYLVVDDDPSWPSGAFNWHIKRSTLGEEIFASFSRRNDSSRAPSGFRCVNVSHHEPLSDTWFKASEIAYKKDKSQQSDQMMRAFSEVTKIESFRHMEVATPRTWKHYTHRPLGTVGGLPLSRRWTLFRTPKRFLGSPDLIQIGDTSFPGQSLYACALSAGMAVESIS